MTTPQRRPRALSAPALPPERPSPPASPYEPPPLPAEPLFEPPTPAPRPDSPPGPRETRLARRPRERAGRALQPTVGPPGRLEGTYPALPSVRRETRALAVADVRRGATGVSANILSVTTCIVLLAALAIWTRFFHLASAWDIHVDEITYLHLSRVITATGQSYLYGQPFYLHPPLFFILQGLYVSSVPADLDVIQQVLTARHLTAGLAALSGILAFLLVRPIVGTVGGLLAGGLFFADPFLARINTWTLLETPTNVWVLAGYCLLARAVTREDRLRPLEILGIGGMFGLAILTKDVAIFVTLLPVAICGLLDRPLRRRDAAWIALVAVGAYAVYPLMVLLQGEAGPFLAQKLRGLSRLSGVVQETGFNRRGGPSLAAAIQSNLVLFGPTFLLLGCQLFAIPMLARVSGPVRQVVLAWTVSALGLLSFLVTIGTLEEQFLYYLLVPTVVATSIAIMDAVALWPDAIPTQVKVVGLAVIAVVYAEWALYSWYLVRMTPDNGYEHMRAYLDSHVPYGTRIASTTEEVQFMLRGYETGLWGTVDEVRASGAEYVVINVKQVANRYGVGTPELYSWLLARGEPVWSFRSRTHWELILFRVSDR